MPDHPIDLVRACWHCGAPVQQVQRHCLTCGASREYHPEEYGPLAVETADGPEAAAETGDAPETPDSPNVAVTDA